MADAIACCSFFNSPLSDLRSIVDTQKIVALIVQHASDWPLTISNGTIMVMEKFYETAVDEIPQQRVFPYPFMYKLFSAPDYSLVKYSVGHFADFIRGMQLLVKLLDREGSPDRLKSLMQRAAGLMDNEILRSLSATYKKLSSREVIYYGHYIRGRFRLAAHELNRHSQPPWTPGIRQAAMATKKYRLSFPAFSGSGGALTRSVIPFSYPVTGARGL